MRKVHVNDDLWVAVKVERGFPGEVKAFFTEKMALKQERIWQKQINFDYDDTGVFKIKLSEINISLKDRRG
jgi:hypothetical protein